MFRSRRRSDEAAVVVADEVFRATLRAADGLVDVDRFRNTMSAFPAAVSVVTSLDEDGHPRGLACSAVCSLSMEPPMLLICVHRRNGSLRAIRHSGGFCVNLLRAGRSEISNTFASPSPDKFAGITWRPSPVSGLPWLSNDTLAYVDCQLAADIEAGSHAILVGTVRDSLAVTPPNNPLLYWLRNYGTWQTTSTPPPLAAVR